MVENELDIYHNSSIISILFPDRRLIYKMFFISILSPSSSSSLLLNDEIIETTFRQ